MCGQIVGILKHDCIVNALIKHRSTPRGAPQRNARQVPTRTRSTRWGHKGSPLDSQVNYNAQPKLFRLVDEVETTGKAASGRSVFKRKLSDIHENDSVSSRTTSQSAAPQPAKRAKQSVKLGEVHASTSVLIPPAMAVPEGNPSSRGLVGARRLPSMIHRQSMVSSITAALQSVSSSPGVARKTSLHPRDALYDAYVTPQLINHQ